jgi:hypothetical protein
MMTVRFTASRLLLATACGAALLSATMLSAPTASAACTGGNVADPITGVCWAQSQFGSGISGTGGTCLPGRLGLCLGALQNSQIPGANLPTNTDAGSGRADSWP